MRRETRRASIRYDEGTGGRDALLMKTMPNVATEMALSVLAHSLTRVMNIIGVKPLIAAIGA